MRKFPESAAWYRRAVARITGGVSSPARHYGAMGMEHPVFFNRARGAYMWDVDGNRYIDYLAAFAPGILGHAHPAVVAAVHEAVSEGTLYGTPTPWEVELAEELHRAIPSLEQVRFVSTGTEAVMSAVRLARAHTRRVKVIKFEGCYHGHTDLALIEAGSGPATLGQQASAGIPASTAREVITIPWNDPAALADACARWGGEVAAVLVEPVVGNMGIVPPEPGYLEAVVAAAHGAGALVIFDEVITGFRFCYGGVQQLLGVTPDLTCLGKILGGGLPIGAYGGRQDLMELVAPLGPVYQAGTMAGNPLSVRAALASLSVLRQPGVYEDLEAKGRHLADGLVAAAERHGVPVRLNRLGSAFALYFSDRPVRDYTGAKATDGARFARFFRAMLERGVLLAPSRYEAWFVQIPHTDADLDYTLAAADGALREAAAG